MKVSEMMSGNVCVVSPEDTLAQAATLMARHDVGSLPVGQDDRLVGFVTDRDIAIRAVAQGLGSDARVREVMSSEVKYCFEDDDVERVAQNMADLELRRLPVVNRDKRLVGIVSLGNFAQCAVPRASQELLEGVAARH